MFLTFYKCHHLHCIQLLRQIFQQLYSQLCGAKRKVAVNSSKNECNQFTWNAVGFEPLASLSLSFPLDLASFSFSLSFGSAATASPSFFGFFSFFGFSFFSFTGFGCFGADPPLQQLLSTMSHIYIKMTCLIYSNEPHTNSKMKTICFWRNLGKDMGYAHCLPKLEIH